MNDVDWMRRALLLAQTAEQQGEVPVGAVLVSASNELLGEGWNQTLHGPDATAHAEIMAIRDACVRSNNPRLCDATLYVTLEPCCMCAGALVHARIKRLVFGTRDTKAGAAGSVCNALHGRWVNHSIRIDEGFLQQECACLLTNFFKKRRFS